MNYDNKKYRYFIVTYSHMPDGSMNEAVRVDERVRKQDMLRANVILDFKEQRIEKLRLADHNRSMSEWNLVREYYHEQHKDLIDRLERDQLPEQPHGET
jgi:hypothetical protein